jgi:predicted amino acid dehydrogenase
MNLGPILHVKSNVRKNGVAIACPLLPQHFATLDHRVVLTKVISAVRVASQAGARIVGLGGLTSSFTDEGQEVITAVDIAITSGNSYTAFLCIQGLIKAAQLFDLRLSESKLTVIGATGDIGSACTRVLATEVGALTLAARNEQRLYEFARTLRVRKGSDVSVTRRTSDAIKDADLILTATSAVSTVIEPSNLKPGAIVCDVAYPANVARDIHASRPDIFVFEGGLATWPGYESIEGKSKLQRFSPPGTLHGCLAETIILTLAERFVSFSLGRGNITEDKLNEIRSLAEEQGFILAPLQYAGKVYSDADIVAMKEAASEYRR